MDEQAPAPKKNKPAYNFRAQHRARSHESAHTDAGLSEDHSSPVPEMALVYRGPTRVVETAGHLQELIADLRTDGSFAYDSEFIGELTYHPKLCVIQVASRHRVALIDPLAGFDLAPFWELLADPSVEKIVHAGEQDIEPVVRHLQRPAANVFDTQISAGFVGLPYPMSLSKLVAELTGARLGKGLTFSHWDQRPLSAVQLRYAADDVRYLPAAAAELIRRLDARKHTAWAKEECASVCSPDLYQFDPQTQFLRVRGATSLQPKNLAILRELTIWRDAAARVHDMPPRSFLKDEVLVDLARTPTRTVESLAKVRGLPRPVENEYGVEIIESITRGSSLPPVSLPGSRESELSPAEKFRSDAVFAATQCICAGLGLDPALVASRQEVGDFYRFISSKKTGNPPALLRGWRKEAVGDLLTEFLHGDKKIDLNWKAGALQAKAM